MTASTQVETTNEGSSCRFLVAGEFSYTARVRHLQRPQGHLNLRISSLWGKARNPQDEQVVLNLTLSQQELAALIATLQAQA